MAISKCWLFPSNLFPMTVLLWFLQKFWLSYCQWKNVVVSFFLLLFLQVIPDFPTLRHTEKKETVLPYFVKNLEDKNMKEEDGQVSMEAEFSIPDPRKVRYTIVWPLHQFLIKWGVNYKIIVDFWQYVMVDDSVWPI